MARVIVEMDFEIEEFYTMSDEERFEAIEYVLESGAESTCSSISIESITIKE